MKDTSAHDEKFAKMSFASVYPHYLAKVEKKEEQKMNSIRSFNG